MSKSIGSVFIDIEARTAKLEEGVAKAQSQLKGMREKLEKAGGAGGASLDALGLKFLKFNLYAQLAANLVGALGQAISQVNNNAAELGRAGVISPGAVAAVEANTVAWERFKQGVSATYAELVKFGGYYAEAVGNLSTPEQFGLSGNLLQYAMPFGGAVKGYEKEQARLANAGQPPEEVLAQARAGGAANYEIRREQLVKQVGAAQRDADLAGMERIERIIALRQRETNLLALAATLANKGPVAQLEALLEAQKAGQQANAEERADREYILSLDRQIAQARAETAEAGLADVDKLASLTDRLADAENIYNAAKKRGGALTKEEQLAGMTIADVTRKIAALKGQMLETEKALVEDVAQADAAARLASLSGQAKINAMLEERNRLEKAFWAERDTGRKAALQRQIDATTKGIEDYKTSQGQRTAKALDELARTGGKDAEVPDAQRLAELTAMIAANEEFIARMRQAGTVASEQDLARIEGVNHLMTEQLTIQQRLYASDADARAAFAELDRTKKESSKGWQSEAEERTALLERIHTLETRVNAARESGNKLTKDALNDVRQLTKAHRQYGEVLVQQREQWNQVGQMMAQTMLDGIMNGQKFEKVLKNLLQALVNYIMQQMVVKALGNMLGGFGSSIFGGVGAGAGEVAGARAVGGPVMAGESYLVGEQGPELFTPQTSGMVSTAQATASAGAEPSISYSQVYNIASGVTANELRPILDQHAKAVREATRSSIMSDLARGGKRASQFGG